MMPKDNQTPEPWHRNPWGVTKLEAARLLAHRRHCGQCHGWREFFNNICTNCGYEFKYDQAAVDAAMAKMVCIVCGGSPVLYKVSKRFYCKKHREDAGASLARIVPYMEARAKARNAAVQERDEAELRRRKLGRRESQTAVGLRRGH